MEKHQVESLKAIINGGIEREISNIKNEIEEQQQALNKATFLKRLEDVGCDIAAGISENGVNVYDIMQTAKNQDKLKPLYAYFDVYALSEAEGNEMSKSK